MTRRYYLQTLPTEGGLVCLSPEEAEHAARVMRAQVGDTMTVFDGIGNEAEAIIQSLGRRECICVAQPCHTVPRMPAVDVTMAIALPKPDRSKELVERLTELGVKRLIPLVADRTQRPPSESLLGKLRRVVIEACKQSGRNLKMEIDDPITTSDYFASHLDEPKPSSVQLIAHINGQKSDWQTFKKCKSIEVAIGPEGGWSEREYEMAIQHHFHSVQLGQRILRIETAAAAIAANLTLGH